MYFAKDPAHAAQKMNFQGHYHPGTQYETAGARTSHTSVAECCIPVVVVTPSGRPPMPGTRACPAARTDGPLRIILASLRR
jgi:hypothetical protein